MTLASDPRYRSVRLGFVNNDARGNEFIQLLAKADGGEWGVQRLFPVGDPSQVTSWDTALPVTAYDIAMRYLNGSVPAVGYESTDPDAWTAPTAADSKSTVTTTSEPSADLAGSYISATGKLRLTWSCAQQDVPFLVEKSPHGAGTWSTVVADLASTSYDYTPSGGEVSTTVDFRVTPKRGSVAGPTGATTPIFVGIQVGTPTWVSGVWDADTGRIALSWNAATDALTYRLEKQVNAGAWSTVGVISGTTYSYVAQSGESNSTLGFRLRGINGTFEGSLSTTQNVMTTIVITPSVISAVSGVRSAPPGLIVVTYTATFSAAGGDAVSNLLFFSFDNVTFSDQTAVSPSATTAQFGGSGAAGTTFYIKMRAISASYNPSDASTYEDSNTMSGVVTQG